MTGNGGQKGRNGRTPRTSARLSLGPEDEWRSWSQLPDESTDEADDSEPAEATPDWPLGGSMLIAVAPTDAAEPAPAEPTPSEPAPTDPAPVAPVAPASAEAPTSAPAPAAALPRRPRPNLPPPATEPPTRSDAVSEAEADAALAAAMPAIEETFATPAPAPEPSKAARPARVAPPPAATPIAGPADRRRPRPEPLPIFEPARPATTPVPAASTPAPATSDDSDVALVLTSDPELDAPVTRRRPAPPSKNRKLGRSNVGTPWSETAPAERSVSGIVAEALGLLEARVSRQAEETESLVAELEARYAEELARLDGRVHRELQSREGGVPKPFEDRVTASFMQLVERLERLENRPAVLAPISDGSNGDAASDPGTAAALAFVVDQQAGLAATVEDVARRHDQIVAEHDALAAQNVDLAAAQQLVATGQQKVADQLQAVLAGVAALNERVEAMTSTLPEVEQRVAALEHRTGEAIVLLQARVDDLVDRFPVVEGAVEVLTRGADAVETLRGTVEQFRAALDHDIAEVRGQLSDVESMRSQVAEVQERSARLGVDLAATTERLDGVDHRLEEGAAASAEVRLEFDRLQAETDRRASAAEARLLDLEDVIGGEVGVERNLLLDRIEEMERGLYDLDPGRFVRRDEVPGLLTHDDASGPGPEH